MVRALWIFVLAIAGAVVQSAPAGAQTAQGSRGETRPWAEGVSAENQKRATALFEQGNSSLAEGQLAAALGHYVKAVKIWDHPMIRYNMVICLVRLKRYVAAHESLGRALRYGRVGLRDKYEQALTYRALLRGQLGRLTVRVQTVGAEVTLDGAALFTAPGHATRVLTAGHHLLVVSKRGYVTDKRKVLVLPGKKSAVKVALVTLASRIRIERMMAVWKPWLVLGAGVAVLATGVALGVKANADYDTYDKRVVEKCSSYPAGGCTDAQLPQPLKDLRSGADRMRYASYALYAAGGAAAAAGVVLLVLNRVRKVEAPTAVGQPRTSRFPVPTFLPGGFALSWQTSF